MRIGSLCTGAGGLDRAVQEVLGGELAWVADSDRACAFVLNYHYPDLRNLGDIATVDWATVPPVDVLCAGFPCQDVSAAGQRAGLRPGTRSGIWSHCAHAVAVLKPSLVVIENVRGLLSADAHSNVEPCPGHLGDSAAQHALRASGAVCGDLADLLYDAVGTVVSASDVGAPHRRERVFILAWPRDAAADPGGQRPRPYRGGGGAEAPAWPGDGPGRGSQPGPVLGGEATAHPAGQGQERPTGDGSPGEWRLPGQPASEHQGPARWGRYWPAISRWEGILGRAAPSPVERGRTGERLSPAFAEWLMGLPPGWVSGVPALPRGDQLRIIGNGVVPAQAVAALHELLRQTSQVRLPGLDGVDQASPGALEALVTQ